jgi:hypothetical protein
MKPEQKPISLNLQECVLAAASGRLLQAGVPVTWLAIARGSSLELWTELDDDSCSLEISTTCEDSIAALTAAPLSRDEDGLFAIDTAGFWQLLRVSHNPDNFGLAPLLEGDFAALSGNRRCSTAVFKALFVEAARYTHSRSVIVGSLWADAITVLSIGHNAKRTVAAAQCAFNAEALAAGVESAAASHSCPQAAISLAAAADGCLPTGRPDWRWGSIGSALSVHDLALLQPSLQHSSGPVPLAVLYSDATTSDARHSAAVHLTIMHVHFNGSSDSVTLSNGGWSLRHLPADSCITAAPANSSNSTQLLVANSAGVLVCGSDGPLQRVQWPRACSPTAAVALPQQWCSAAAATFLIASAEGALYTAHLSSSTGNIQLAAVQLQLVNGDAPSTECDLPHQRQLQLRAVRCLVPVGAHGLLVAPCSSVHTALLHCEVQQQCTAVATLLQSPFADSVGAIADMAVLCDSNSNSSSAGRGLELALACTSGVDTWLRVLQYGYTMRITAQVRLT